MVSDSSKQYLLVLARRAVEAELDGRRADYGTIPNDVARNAGVFVTLRKHGQLRGCIGSLEPVQQVFKAVAAHACDAAFDDPRFEPVTKVELPQIVFEVSVLGPLTKCECADTSELLKKLKREHPGVMIEYAGRRATFLPQVWEEVMDETEFLESLCMKAGLPGNTWKECFDEMTFYLYTVDKFGE